ncbi:MAG TPA: hypothetical protein VE710_23245 [Candidatus Bathyarchaeia archaeon]|nr:hypothetical protein [Candidatus Bathyarchaeia archaeon]
MADMQQENTVKAGAPGKKDEMRAVSPNQPIPDVLNQVENTIPVGSVDKSRAHAGEPDEQYPIPAARPNPFAENPSG